MFGVRVSVLCFAAALAVGAGLVPGPVLAKPFSIAAPDGAEKVGDRLRSRDLYALPVASFAGHAPTAAVRGDVLWTALRVPAGSQSVNAVIDGYRARLGKQGFQQIFRCAGQSCGGFDFRFGASLMSPPEMRVDVRDFAQLSMGRAQSSGYVSVLASRVAEWIYIQVVTVKPRKDKIRLVTGPDPAEGASVPQVTPAPAPDPGNGSAGGGTPAAAPNDPGAPDGRPLLARLLADGHVKVAGLAFATGGSKLAGESEEALNEMAEMLRANPDLKVAIVGHSDNVGSLDANIELSRRRAAAVRTALIERGVARKRLEARGVGYLAPIVANSTEEGRAINRRVELVLR